MNVSVRRIIRQILKALEAGGLKGAASTFTPDKLILNGAGEFAIGGPEATMGFRERSSLSTITDRACRSAAERLQARIRTKWTSAGRCGPASWPKSSFADESTRLASLWAEAPGGDAPFLIEASTIQGGVSLQVPRQELPPDEWFTIKSIVRDLELHERDWMGDLLGGYFCQASAPWER